MGVATDEASEALSKLMFRGWMLHDPNYTRGSVLIADGLLLAFGLFIRFTLGTDRTWPWVAVTVAVNVGFLVTFFTFRGWSRNWSTGTRLSPEKTRAAIVQALSEGGFAWTEGAPAKAPRYFRPFTGPIEVRAPRAQVWIRRLAVRPGARKRGPNLRASLVVLRPLHEGEDLRPLMATLSEALESRPAAAKP